MSFRYLINKETTIDYNCMVALNIFANSDLPNPLKEEIRIIGNWRDEEIMIFGRNIYRWLFTL